MLKINLLPVRQLQQRAQARQQITFFVIFLCIVIGLVSLTGMNQLNSISDLNKSIAKLKKEEKSFAPILARINKMKKNNAELERKTEVIDKLQTDSSLTVRVLDEVANSVDNTRMWLSSLSQQGGSLTLSGIALDNRTISEFMDILKASPFVNSVDLTSTSMHNVSGRKLKKFSLRCGVSSPAKETKKNESKKS